MQEALMKKDEEEKAEQFEFEEGERRSNSEDDGGGSGETSCPDAGSTHPAREGERDHAEPAALDDGSGGRRTTGASSSGSRHAARGSNEGDDIPPDASATGKSTDDGSTAKWSSNGGNNGVQRELDYDVSPEIPGGVPQEKMHQWLQYNAPRVCLLENSSQRNLWAKLQLEDEDVAEHEKRVLQGYWSESEDHKSWHYYSGILSETANDLKAIGLFANGTWEEDHYEPGQDRALSKASKKAVVKNMKALTVAEVFSPPRVAAMAEELGHRSGGSYDLQTGYDLSSSVDRMKCMKELRQADPDVLIICPPCSPFSLLQELNRGRTSESTWKLRLAEGKEHLAYGMKLYEWQIRRGKWAIFEHPATSRAWQEEVVQRVLRFPGVQRVRAWLGSEGSPQ